MMKEEKKVRKERFVESDDRAFKIVPIEKPKEDKSVDEISRLLGLGNKKLSHKDHGEG